MCGLESELNAPVLQAAEERRVCVLHIEAVQEHEAMGAAGPDTAERSQRQPTEGPGTSGEAGIHVHRPAEEASTWTPHSHLFRSSCDGKESTGKSADPRAKR